MADLYRYNRPTIVESNKSFINGKDIRHPIVERILDNIKYVSNDINIGTDDYSGMLIYGTNASGKSTWQKSIGINIIMAQAGLYVPASSFEYYPFKSLFARIIGNDDIYKGLSSFAVEMLELRNILKRADNMSLVLGDEISHGTESTSGLAIVASAVKILSQRDTKFIFATHLHKLSSLPDIIELENVKHFHLKVIFNEEKRQIIYDRKLDSGPGNSIYGLEVARAMDMSTEFINIANKIRKDIINLEDIDLIMDYKKTNYNKNVYVKTCAICNEPVVDIHHIDEQKNADDDGYIGNFHKNHKSNLIPLCKKHHKMVHDGKLFISGFKQTSDGVILDYRIIE
jgi:DNA mismatch repair protein MutS